MTETREQLEARLKEASDSMSRRLSSMESEVHLPAVTRIRKAVKSGRARKIGLAVGLGLAVGILAGGLGTGSRKKRSKDRWRDDLADSLARHLEEGRTPREAARRAAERRLPPQSDSSSKGVMAVLVSYALKEGIDIVARELMNRFTSRNGQAGKS